jgi:hypothetical protein
MKFNSKYKAVQIFLACMITAMVGCASAPDIASTEKSEGEKYSADEVRHMTVDQPFLTSGEYFRERNQEPERNLSELFAKKEKKAQETVVEKNPRKRRSPLHQRRRQPQPASKPPFP